MNKAAQITAWVCIAAVLLLAAYDIYLAANGVPGDTISEVMRTVARKHPIIPFAAGVIFGHFFW